MKALKELEVRLKTIIAHKRKVHIIPFKYGTDKETAKQEYIRSHEVKAYDGFWFVQIVPDEIVYQIIRSKGKL